MPGYYDHIAKFVRDVSAASGGSTAEPTGAAGIDSELDSGWEKMEKPVDAMSVPELKTALRRRNIDSSKCVEKSEMQSLLESDTPLS